MSVNIELDSESRPDHGTDGAADSLTDESFSLGSLNSQFSDSVQVPKLKSPKILRDYFAHRDRVRDRDADDKPQSRPAVMEHRGRERESEAVSASGNENSAKSTTVTGMTRRCVCNLSQCVSTNYMCKSESRVRTNEDGSTTEVDAGCFVEELPKSQFGVTEANGRVTSARRGCVEHLSREKLKLCSDRTGTPVHCCFNEDMCNYPKTFYPPQFPPNLNRLGYDPQNGARGIPSAQQPVNLDQQVWIRAALICVPICGLMILLVLILVARRLLRSDDEYKETGNGSTSAHAMAAGDGGERMYHPVHNKYGEYYHPSPPPPPIQEYPFITPVFMPSDYEEGSFPGVEIQIQRRQRQAGQCCCCHNPRQQPLHVGNNNGTEPDENNLLLAQAHVQAPSPSSSRSTMPVEDLSPTSASSSTRICHQEQDPDEICQCSSDSDDSRGHCRCNSNMIRPPSIVFAGGGPFMLPGAGQESSASSDTTTATTLKKFNTLLSKLFKRNGNGGPTCV